MDTKILRLDEIIVDNSLNPRIGALDQETVLDYSAHLDDLPSMTVFDGRHWPENPGIYLVGGFHRFAAHQFAGRDVAKFIVRQGDRRAAEEAADLDNLTHGLHLTRAERRGVIVRYLKRHPERSDVWVAKECRTTDKTVRTVREELEGRSEIPRLEKFIGVDGIERPRSIERPPRQDPDEEARKLTIPFELGATLPPTPLALTPLEEAIERAEVEVAAEEEPANESPAWQQFAATPPLAPVAESQTGGEQVDSEPEWLAETGEGDRGDSGEAEAGEASSRETEAQPTDWSQPVREFKSAAPPVSLEAKLIKAGAAETAPAPKPAPAPVAPPPPPPPKPALPPPPPPVIGRAPLGISVSLHVTGTGLLSAMEGDKVIVSSKTILPSSVMWEIQQLIDGYLSKEETANGSASESASEPAAASS